MLSSGVFERVSSLSSLHTIAYDSASLTWRARTSSSLFERHQYILSILQMEESMGISES